MVLFLTSFSKYFTLNFALYSPLRTHSKIVCQFGKHLRGWFAVVCYIWGSGLWIYLRYMGTQEIVKSA